MISVRVTRNDIPKLMRGNSSIANSMDTLLGKIGEMLLDSAQEAMDSSGPGWVQHKATTTKRWGIHKLLHTPEKGNYQSKDGTPLSDIRSNYNYMVSNVFAGKATLEIVGLNEHSRDMYDTHNQDGIRGSIVIANNGARIPSRPYFRWRTGHSQKSELRKANTITTQFIKDTLKQYGIRAGGFFN